jgi:hypothetical protein
MRNQVENVKPFWYGQFRIGGREMPFYGGGGGGG